MTKIHATAFGDYAEVQGTNLVRVDYSDPHNPTGIQILKHETGERPPIVHNLYSNEFIDTIAASAPGISQLHRRQHKISSVKIVETNENAYGDKSSVFTWKGVALDFEPSGEKGERFRMEIFRKHAKGKPNYYKAHGEIRYHQRMFER